MAEFLGGGYYLRHLRKMKVLYAKQRVLALKGLEGVSMTIETSGLALKISLPDHIDDKKLAIQARDLGIAPVPLSVWYNSKDSAKRGLLASVTNIRADNYEAACNALAALLKVISFL